MATSEWLEARRRGITGTDAAAILGLIPKWRTPLQVWVEKTGRMEPPDLSKVERVRMGSELEPVVVQIMMRRTRRKALDIESWADHLPAGRLELLDHFGEQKAMIVSKDHPWLRSTPDALAEAWTPLPWLKSQPARVGPGIGEAKCTGLHGAKDWRTRAPVYYEAQLAVNLITSGLSWGFFGVLIGGQELRVFDMGLADGLRAALIERLERFWFDHVVADRPPLASGARRDREILEHLQPTDTGHTATLSGGTWRVIDRELHAAEARVAELNAELREALERRLALENQLRQAMGSAAFARVEGGGLFQLTTHRAPGYTVAPSNHRKLRRIAPGTDRNEPKQPR